ncbi:MAG: glycoside hydrolase family 127 protein [Microbispora sp.]|nr:glycoside hydrolase family 127 protein [Microbispora sp.]
MAEVCGHPEIETALAELYRLTGHRPYLDLARRFLGACSAASLGARGRRRTSRAPPWCSAAYSVPPYSSAIFRAIV